MTPPRVGVVVLNYNGGDITLECLRSLLATTGSADRLRVMLVDNASHDGIAACVRNELPTVQVLESSTNRGFAGGCNLGIRALLPEVAYVALVNNDATVDPDWLEPLVGTLEQDARLGAACPKILFAGQYVDLSLEAPTFRRGWGDPRDLGVFLSGTFVDGEDVWSRTQLLRGFWGREPTDNTCAEGEWTASEAQLRLPVGADNHSAALRLSAPAPVLVTVASGGTRSQVEVGPNPSRFEIPLGGPQLDIVNNLGTDLVADGYGADRGYLEPDDGRFDSGEDVFAWCGAAALLRREYLEDVGLFDERLFLYYEDLELAWRGRRRGWRYRYVPESTVRHLHAATTGTRSTLKHYFDERNRLLVFSRHAPASTSLRATSRFLVTTASYARRDIVSRMLRGTRPRPRLVSQRLRAFVGYVLRTPAILRTRRGDRHDGLEAPAWPTA